MTISEQPSNLNEEFIGSSLGGQGVADLCLRTPLADIRMVLLKASVSAPSDSDHQDGPGGPFQKGWRAAQVAGQAFRRLTGGRRRIWIMLGMVATIAVFLVLPEVAPDSRLTLLYVDLVPSAAAFGATAMCRYAVRRSLPELPRRERRRQNLGWILLGLATLSWGLGELAWTWYELSGSRVPLPSAADIGYLVCLPLMTAAMVLFAIVSGYPASWARVLVDGVVVALSLFGITWIFSLGKFLLDDPSPLLERLIVTAYPLGDVLALAIALTALAHSRKRDVVSFGLVAGGILGLGFSDLAFLYQTQSGVFQSGKAMDLGWLIGFFLIGLAALYRPERPVWSPDSQPEDFFMREVLPYGATTALLLAATAQALAGHQVGGTLMVIITVVVLMNMIKQIPLRRAKAEIFAESLDTAKLSSDVVWVTEAVAADLAWLQQTEDDLRAGSDDPETTSIDLDVLTMRALYASQQAEKLNVKTLHMQKRISQCIPARRVAGGRAAQTNPLAPPDVRPR